MDYLLEEIVILITSRLGVDDILDLYKVSKNYNNTIKKNNKIIYKTCIHIQPHGRVSTIDIIEDTIVEVIKNYKDGVLDGPYLRYRNNILDLSTYMLKGLQHGLTSDYYANGLIKSNVIYYNGIIVDIFRTYYSNGYIKCYAPICDGVIKGYVKTYLSNGYMYSKSYNNRSI